MLPITFLSDYGHADAFAGICHGVIARIAPGAVVLDVTHGIARHDVRAGALVLEDALPYLPPGVHLAVVDPEVGARRRAVALRCAEEGRLLVGPDNGLLGPAAARFGGVVEAVDLARSPHRLEPVSATFHGRDLFAPVAAQLAAGAPLAAAGDPLAPDEVVALELPEAHRDGGALVVHALMADRFGNVILNAGHATAAEAGLRLGHAVEVGLAGAAHPARYASTFADVAPGELLVYEDAAGRLSLAVNRGSAHDELVLERDAELRLRPAP